LQEDQKLWRPIEKAIQDCRSGVFEAVALVKKQMLTPINDFTTGKERQPESLQVKGLSNIQM
jgi:hypothetical protein